MIPGRPSPGPPRDPGTGHYTGTGQTPRPPFAPPPLSRGAAIAMMVLACYFSGLLAVNLVGSPYFANSGAATLSNRIFPRIGAAQGFSSESLNAEYDLIQENYVYRDVPADKLTQGAEAGMVTALHNLYQLDRFTAFLDKVAYTSYSEGLSSTRSGAIGIGVVTRCDGGLVCAKDQPPSTVVITDVLVNQPADKAGIKNGDVLVAVDGTKVATLAPTIDAAIDKISPLIRGDAGKSVHIDVLRRGKPIGFDVVRANLQIPSVYAKRLGGILYIEVTGFDTDTKDVLHSLLKDNISGAAGIILDLRSNPGGYVEAAQELASEFLTPSDKVQDVVVTRGRMNSNGDPSSAQVVEHTPVKDGGIAHDPKMVVLVDGNTASAAEIVTAAMHDYKRATIIGVKTFGKGSVQTDFPLPDGSDLHLTIEKWFGPNDENIDGVGITPDTIVTLPNPENRFRIDSQSGDQAADPQFQAALKALGG